LNIADPVIRLECFCGTAGTIARHGFYIAPPLRQANCKVGQLTCTYDVIRVEEMIKDENVSLLLTGSAH